MKAPPPNSEKTAYLPAGWTRSGWASELRRRADLCAETHPERAAEFRDWAEIHEREDRAREEMYSWLPDYYGGIKIKVTAG